MSLLTQIFAAPPPRTGTSPSGGLDSLLLSASGIIQGGARQEAQALVNTTMRRIVSLIGTTNAALPLDVVQRGDRSRTRLREESHRYLWGRPNPSTRRINLWESVYAAMLLPGNAFLWKDRATWNARRPWEGVERLWYVSPGRVAVGQAQDGSKVFRMDGDRSREFTERHLLHMPALSVDGIVGVPPIDSIAGPTNLLASGLRFNKRVFDSPMPGGIISTQATITPEDAEQIAERWRDKKAGIMNALDVAVFGHGAEYKPLTVSPEQALITSALEHWELRLAQAYGVPPHMIGLVNRSTSWGTGIEQQVLGFVQFTLMEWIVRVEQAIEDELIAPDMQAKFNLSALLRGDTLQRFGAYRLGIASKFLTPNEARELEDRPPLPGGDAVVEQGTTSSGMDGGGGMGGPQPPAARRIADARLTTDNADDVVEAIERQLRAQHYAERVEQQIDALLPEGRCPQCDKLLARRVNAGAEVECKRCRETVAVV